MVKIRKKKGDQAQMGKVIKQLGVGIYVADLDEVPALCHVNQMATSVAEDNSSRPEDKAKASILPNPASVPNFSKPTSVPDMSYPTSVPNMSNPTSVPNMSRPNESVPNHGPIQNPSTQQGSRLAYEGFVRAS